MVLRGGRADGNGGVKGGQVAICAGGAVEGVAVGVGSPRTVHVPLVPSVVVVLALQ